MIHGWFTNKAFPIDLRGMPGAPGCDAHCEVAEAGAPLASGRGRGQHASAALPHPLADADPRRDFIEP